MSDKTVHLIFAPFAIVLAMLSFGLFVNTSVFTLYQPENNTQITIQERTVLGEKVEAEIESGFVDKVIDGDTIKLSTGEIVRYIGIDAPELRLGECFSTESTEFNRNLVEGRMVKLVKDKSDIDVYGRKLRYIYVGEIFVNEHLVSGGYARSASYLPDVAYQGKLAESEIIAIEGGKGMWGECN